MLIGLIAPPWIPVPPPAYGGVEEVIDGLARGLTGLGHRVLLAAGPGSSCPVARVASTERAAEAPIGDLRSERRHVAQAYSAFRDAGVEIVHDHTLSGPRHPGRLRTVPTVATAHGPFVPELRQVYGAVPPDVAIIGISEHQASTAGSVPIARVIHHGIDMQRIRAGNGDGGYLAFLGRMTPDKGVREAILIARRAGVPLRIAAKMREPAEQEYFSTVIAPLLGAGIEYLGELNRAEKYALLGSALALLNPIQWAEPFGMVMIEALATGTPVIASPRGAAPEIVEQDITGALPENIQAFVTAIHGIERLDRTVVRRRAEQRFSLEPFARRHEQFYQELLAERNSPVVSKFPVAG